MKLFKTKKAKIISLMSTVLGGTAAALILSCVAWFSQVDQFKPYDVRSSVITSYFDSGTGTQADPYVITRPIHYWNLVYLQESNLDGFASGQLYFQIGKDLDNDGYAEVYEYDDNGVLQWEDPATETQEKYSNSLNMTYYQGDKAIVPLGSGTHPFTGHINGNDLTIDGLHIDGTGRSDIGVFGYCDNHATVSNLYLYDVSIDIGTPNPLETGSHTPSHTTTANIGYICGHVYDADYTFNDVYVNECEIYNSVGSTGTYDILNTYSYFGRVDIVDPIETATASYRSDLNPTTVHNFLDTNYNGISGEGLKSRDTEYSSISTGKNFGDAVGYDSTNDYYSMNSNFSNTYDTSLSTVGYASGDTVVKNVRYKDGDEFNRIASTTSELDHVPTSSDEDGKYLYYSNSQWHYAVVTSEQSEETTVNYNCFYISYTYSSTLYYLKYDADKLVVTTTAPADATDIDNYYFVFKDIEGSSGVATFRSTDEQTGYYIYSPANRKYLYQITDESTMDFTDTFANAYVFNVKGPTTSISFKRGTADRSLLADSSSIKGKHTSGTVDPTIFNIGNVQEDADSSTATYDLVTDASVLTDGCVVAIGTGTSGDIYVMSTTQNSNNRGTTAATITSDGYITNVTNLCELTLHYDSTNGGWSFYDKTYNNNAGGYLYAAGTKTSGANYLRTEESLDDKNYGLWTISVASTTSLATITNVGNSYIPYMLYNDGTNGDQYKLFASYSSTSKGSLPTLFLRNEAGLGKVYYSNSTVRPYTSSSSSEEKTILTYDVYVGPLNATTYTQLFTVQRTDTISVIFDYANSKVSYTATQQDGWTLVKSVSSIEAGDTLAIVATDYNYAISTTQNSNNRGQAAVTKSDDTITFADDAGVAQFTLGGSSGAWTFYDGAASTGAGYLATTESTSSARLKTSTTLSEYTSWTISVTTAGVATITNTGKTSYNVVKYNNGSSLFACYTSGMQNVSIYKYIHEDTADASYISDEIGGYYNPQIMDVVGQANFYSTYCQIPGASTSATGATSAVGQKFYATQRADNALIVYVKNSGSRDLGTLTIAYDLPTDSDAYPVIISSRTGSTVDEQTFEELNCHDLDDGAGYKYMFNVNVNTIGSVAYCALTADGTIYATYNEDGSVAQCMDETYTTASIDRYVLYVGVNPGSGSNAINITSARFEFTQAPGNVGNFGSVGYRTAMYNADGSINEEESRISDTVLNFYYIISTEGVKVYAKVFFNHASDTYEITFTSTAACTIYVFNYEANTYGLTVNGQTCSQGTNVIQIEATNS